MNVFELEGSITLDSSAYEKAVKDAMKDGEGLGKSLQENAKQFQAMQAQIDSLSKELAASKSDIERMRSELAKSAKAADENASATSEMKSELDKAEKAIDDVSESLDDERKSADKAGKETDEYGDSAEEAADDTKKFDKEADKLGGTLSGLITKLGAVAGAIKTGFVTAVKVGVGAVTAASAAVVGLTSKSVSMFGEYEQLAGGAQKIFDEMDYSQIAEDAANAYKDLNLSASQYLESINLAGATFAQTMGDKKGYETARTGMLAIADYASGTGKNIEELNTKFQMITRATSSYQSIADQFSGILPATSADFLEQAQAAGFLAEEYTNLTDVPVAEYQEAVTKMLEKGVDDLGLSNNTAREATETLTGSIAMTKAAWENLITGFSDPDADLELLISNFVESAEASFKNIIPTVQQALTGISDFITGIAPVISDKLPELINNVVPSLLTAATTILDNLGKAVQSILPNFVTTIFKQLPNLLKTGASITTSLFTAVQEALSSVAEALSDKENSNKITAAFTDIVRAVVDGIGGVLEIAPTLIPELLELIGNALVDSVDIIGNGIINMLPDIENLIYKTAPVLFEVISNLADTLSGLMPELMTELLPGIVELIGDLVTALYDSDLIPSLWNFILVTLDAVAKGLVESKDVLLDVLPEIIAGLFDVANRLISENGDDMFALVVDIVKNIIKLCYEELIVFGISVGTWLADGLLSLGDTLGSWLYDRVEAVKRFASDVISKITDFFGNLVDKFIEFKDNVSSKFTDIYDTIRSKITGAVNSARQWGSDLITNFVGGITDNIHKVTDAVSGIADNVKSYIGFSEPEKGALSNFHTFAPDMLDLFASGIRENADNVYREIQALTDGISSDINTNVSVEHSVSPSMVRGGSITINNTFSFEGVNIASDMDIEEITDSAVEKLSEKLQTLDVFNNLAIGGGIA